MESNFLSIVPNLSKADQKNAVETFVAQVLNGDIAPFEAIVKVKAIAETCAGILKDKELTDAVISESLKYGKGEKMSWGGAGISIRETGVKYDYTACDDDEINDLYAQQEELKAKIKEREKFLSGISCNGFEYVDANTGEIRKLHRPAKSSTTSFAITFKK